MLHFAWLMYYNWPFGKCMVVVLQVVLQLMIYRAINGKIYMILYPVVPMLYFCVFIFRCFGRTWQPCQLSRSYRRWNGCRHWILGQLPQDLELRTPAILPQSIWILCIKYFRKLPQVTPPPDELASNGSACPRMSPSYWSLSAGLKNCLLISFHFCFYILFVAYVLPWRPSVVMYIACSAQLNCCGRIAGSGNILLSAHLKAVDNNHRMN